MIAFVDDAGWISPPEGGGQDEADLRNNLLEKKGFDDLGFWFVVDERSSDAEDSN